MAEGGASGRSDVRGSTSVARPARPAAGGKASLRCMQAGRHILTRAVCSFSRTLCGSEGCGALAAALDAAAAAASSSSTDASGCGFPVAASCAAETSAAVTCMALGLLPARRCSRPHAAPCHRPITQSPALPPAGPAAPAARCSRAATAARRGPPPQCRLPPLAGCAGRAAGTSPAP